MKTLKSFLFVITLTGAFTLTSCDDHDENNEITIEILKPTTSIVTDIQNFEVHIKFTATGELHDLEVELHPEGDKENKIIEWDKHIHKKSYEFKESRDLSSFPAGTEFHLEVKACKDEKCKDFVVEDFEFKI